MSHKKLSRRYRSGHDDGYLVVDGTHGLLRHEANGNPLRHNGIKAWFAAERDKVPTGPNIWNTVEDDGQQVEPPEAALTLQLRSLVPCFYLLTEDVVQEDEDDVIRALRGTERDMLDKFNAIQLRRRTLKSALDLMMQQFEYVFQTDKNDTHPSWHALHQFNEDSLEPILQDLLVVTEKKEELTRTLDLYPSGIENNVALNKLKKEEQAIGKRLKSVDNPELLIKRIFATMRAYIRDWQQNYPEEKQPFTDKQLFALAAFRGAAD